MSLLTSSLQAFFTDRLIRQRSADERFGGFRPEAFRVAPRAPIHPLEFAAHAGFSPITVSYSALPPTNV